jgi:adenylate cyclase
VVGDTANLASRIESLTKLYGVSTLFTEFTRARLEKQDDFCFREVDRVVVKGRTSAVSIYELYDCDTGPIQAQKHATLDRFMEALARYREGDFRAACRVFEDCAVAAPDDNVTRLYIERCGALIETPPAEPWRGVWVLDEK